MAGELKAVRLFRRIEILFLRIQNGRKRAQRRFELFDRRRGQGQPDRVRGVTGAGGECRRWRQRDIAPGCGGDECLRTPVRGQSEPEVIGLAVGLDLESGKAAGRNFLALLRIASLQLCKLGGGAVAHQLLRGREGKS
jgi:hypothetical protein